nr:YjcZ family sporulation protein [Bacillus litorisediminis]
MYPNEPYPTNVAPAFTAPAYTAPYCTYTAPAFYPGGNWFALIVVLFILLIIIGAVCYCK